MLNLKTIGILAFVCCALAACQSKNSKANPVETSSASAETLPWATDLDLVCEMKVDKTTEDTVHYNGKIYGFCNPGCKETFQENPTKYGAK